MKEKKCECGNIFVPYVEEGQVRCIYCILKEKPEPPAEHLPIRSTAFAEWFIYKWHNIRKAAAKAKRVPFEFDDGVIGKEVVAVNKSKSIAEMARERGLKPYTVTRRIQRGWTLDEALEGKRRK